MHKDFAGFLICYIDWVLCVKLFHTLIKTFQVNQLVHLHLMLNERLGLHKSFCELKPKPTFDNYMSAL